MAMYQIWAIVLWLRHHLEERSSNISMSQATSFRATDPEFGQWRNRIQNKQNGSIFTQINGTFCQLQSLRIPVFAHAMILFAKKL